MAEALVMTSTCAVKKETNYGEDPTLKSTDVIRIAGTPDLNPDYDMVDPAEIANTKDVSTEIRTGKFCTGSISINMRGSGTSGSAPEGDCLYEAAIGVKSTNAADVCGAASTTTAIVVADDTKFHVGDAIAVICPTLTTGTTAADSTATLIKLVSAANFNIGDVIQVPNADGAALIEATRVIGKSGNDLTVFPALTAAPNAAQTIKKATIGITWVTDITAATNTLTVSPAVTAAPEQYTRIRAGVHYKLTTADLPSLWLSYWRGNITREDYGGLKIDSMEFDVSSGGIIVPKFSFKGNYSFHETEAYGLGTPTFNTLDPLVGMSQTLIMGGSTVEADKFQFRINNTIYDRKSITTEGITKRIQTKRRVEGSFSVLYEDSGFQDDFENDQTAEAILIMGRNGFMPGHVMALRIPALRYLKVPVNADSDLWKYEITWQAQRTLGEDSITSLSVL